MKSKGGLIYEVSKTKTSEGGRGHNSVGPEVFKNKQFKPNKMSDFKTRLLEEKAQLEERTNKLEVFLNSEKANDINPTQLMLLHIQESAMKTYLCVLGNRIELLES